MADLKTSDEASASALSGAELVRIVQSGSNARTTTQDIANLGPGAVAGSDTQIQYNGSGAFAADSRLTFDATNKVAKGQFSADSGAINTQTGTTYTLVATDNGKTVTLNNASSITLTVPSGLGVGFSCMLVQLGAGQVTITASSTTLNSRNGLKLAGQYAAASLIAYAADTFSVCGDTST